MSKFFITVAVLTIGIFSLCQDVLAQRSIFLTRTIDTGFVPDDGYFLIDRGDQKILRSRAVLIPPQGDDSKRSERQGWRVGTKLLLDAGAARLSYSIIVIGLKGDLALVGPVNIDLSSSGVDGVDDLRSQLMQRKQVLQSWEVQLDTQDGSLKRLRDDAQVIGNLGRIVEIRDDIVRANAQSLALDQTIIRLKNSIQRARDLPTPQNFSKRELQLTQQLSELVSLSSEAQSSELSRRAEAEAEVQRRMNMIEQSRLEDLDQLQAELDRLNAMIQRYSPAVAQPTL